MSGRKSQWEPISDAQLAALNAWRMAMGKAWKAKLLAAWESAGAGYSAYAPELQQLRNGWGPSWLKGFKIPPKTECEPARLAPLLAGEVLTSKETRAVESAAIAALELIARNAATALASAHDNRAKAFNIMRNAPYWPGIVQAAQIAESIERPLRNRETPEILVTLSVDQARALHWFARHLGFDDAFASTPPHLSKEIRDERAYGIVHAAAALEEQLMEAQMHGDPWMYAS